MNATLERPWDALWCNCAVATFAAREGYGEIEDAALAVRDGRIAWVGPRRALPRALQSASTRVEDGAGRWITPGLIDSHTHLVYAGQRAREFEMRLEGASYADIARAGGGIRATVAATRAAGEDELLDQSRRRLEAMLAAGVTTLEIKSGYGLETATELRMLRVAQRLGECCPVTVRKTFLGAHAVPPEFDADPDGYIDHLCAQMLPAAVEAGLVDAVDAFCETIGFSVPQTARVFDAATRLGVPVKLHAEQLSDSRGAVLAARYGALSADHLEYLGADGIAAMARAGTVAVLLPGAFYFLRETRRPPVQALRDAGVSMAIATDCNPGSSPTGSLLLMLNMACTLFGLTPAESLAGVTRHAARALGMAATHGTLEVGKTADFAVWDIAHPAELSYRFGDNPCVRVIRNGEVVHRAC